MILAWASPFNCILVYSQNCVRCQTEIKKNLKYSLELVKFAGFLQNEKESYRCLGRRNMEGFIRIDLKLNRNGYKIRENRFRIDWANVSSGIQKRRGATYHRGHLIMHAGHPVDSDEHFLHPPSPIKGTNRIS